MNKSKLTDKQFFLILNGPSCGGKSSVSDIITGSFGGIFNANSDKIKWLISDYNAEQYRGLVHTMTLELIRIALNDGLSVVKEGALYEPENLVAIARELNVPMYVANIYAQKEVLLERFQKRIEAKKKGAQISNTDPKRFEKIVEMYEATKMDTPLEFDSSSQSPEEIADAIISYIKQKLD